MPHLMKRLAVAIFFLYTLIIGSSPCIGFQALSPIPCIPSPGRTLSGRFTSSIHTSLVSINLEQEENGVEETSCPQGYFYDAVEESCTPLSPIGRASQAVENFGPFQKVSNAISNLFGIDTKKISSLGVTFALSYSFLSQVNGSITLSVATYLSMRRTGLSPLAPGEWKSLLAAYGTIYAAVQVLRPFRVAAAVAMSKLSREFLEATEEKLDCDRRTAVVVQYALGWVAWFAVATAGVSLASLATGVPILSTSN
eukprot:scaffold8150_cov118-Cylindrotheca_fusiformis.AAC.20